MNKVGVHGGQGLSSVINQTSNAFNTVSPGKTKKKKRMFDTKMNWLTKSDLEFFKKENYQDSDDQDDQKEAT